MAKTGRHRVAPTVRSVASGDWRRLLKLGLAGGAVLVPLVLRGGDVGLALVLGLLTATVIRLVPARLSVAIGIACLACCPIALIGERYAWLQQSPIVNYAAAVVGLYSLQYVANALLTFAFYFLCIGLLGRVIEFAVRQHGWENA